MMTTELKPHEIENEIGDRLDAAAYEYWAGMGSESRNEILILAQRE